MEIKSFKVGDILADVYQRPVSQPHVAKIVREYDERLLGLPVVSVRDNGSCYVVDGQHRIAALAALGVSEVSCQVLRESDAQAEAALFVKVNTTKKGLTGVDKFFGLIEAKNESALACRKLFAKNGWTLVRGSSTRVMTNGELMLRPNANTLALFQKSPDELGIALSLLAEAFPPDSNGLRSGELARSLVNMTLIGGLTAAISAWVRAGKWSELLRATAIEVLRSAQLRDFIAAQIPVELANKTNGERQMGASAMALAQRVAAKSKKHAWRLDAAEVSALNASQVSRAFAAA
jgi:hypothetical protein